MTRDGLEQVDREELIEPALSAHAAQQTAQATAEQEKARRVEVERQLAWFKKQLFGQKSEKRLGEVADVTQLSLGESIVGEGRPIEKTISVKAHVREGTKAPEPKEGPAPRSTTRCRGPVA